MILHHYDTSPFSEKVRLIFGAKGIAWQSVIVPSIMPKPDVVALTGGYRRTPFLQVGADIYCDTALMCKVIDAAVPPPPLYPQAIAGMAEILAQWADSALFWVAVPFTMQPASLPYMFPNPDPAMLKAFMADRAAMAPNMVRATVPDAAAQVATHLARLENMLADGRDFLLGGMVCIADFSVYQSLWFMRRSPPVGAMQDGYTRLGAWYDRMTAFGHGSSARLSSADAIAVAAAAPGHAPVEVDPAGGFAAGSAVSVMPTDYAQDAVLGALVGLTQAEIVLARQDARAGRVHVHFPRIGFQLRAA